MKYHRLSFRSKAGLTLVELMVVAAILVIVSGALIPIMSGHLSYGRDKTARASLNTIRDAIMGTSDTPGYLGDTGRLPATLNDLFVKPAAVPPFDRESGIGWRGPYLLNGTGQYTITSSFAPYVNTSPPDTIVLDPWGNPFVLQRSTVGTPAVNDVFARLISAGPNGRIDTPQDFSGTPYPPPSERGDDIVLFINRSDTYP